MIKDCQSLIECWPKRSSPPKKNMKRLLAISMLISGLCCAVSPHASAADNPSLDVLKMHEIPAGSYDVQLQSEGKNETVKLSIKNNRATFVRSSSNIFDGLSGEFELIGNGVFLARLARKAGGASQWWIFHPDGSATVKEIPDRGEKQTAKRSSDQ
jgi:hypothetical protein